MVASIIVQTVTDSLATTSALVIAVASMIGVALRWAITHTHPGRLLVLETKVEKLDEDMGNTAALAQSHSADIAKVAAVADVLIPQLNTAATSHAQQIADLQKQIVAITAQITQAISVLPPALSSSSITTEAHPPSPQNTSITAHPLLSDTVPFFGTTSVVVPAAKTEPKKE
jgi:hypothetical protein